MKQIKRVLNFGILALGVLFIMITLPGQIWANDSSGIVFDSVSNQPIDGATVTLERYITNTGQWTWAISPTDFASPAGATNPQTSGWTGNPGKYQFIIALGSCVSKTFRLKVDGSSLGYLFPSTLTSAEVLANCGARHLGDNSTPPPADDPDISWGQQFDVIASDNWSIDLPVDYCQPDVQIKNKGAASYQGDGVYNITGINQAASQSVYINNTVTYYIKIENDGTITTTFRIIAAPGGSWSGFEKYYDALVGGNSITEQMNYSTWTVNLAAGATKEIRVEITPGSVVQHGWVQDQLLSALVQSDANIKDTVKATTTAYSQASVRAGSSGDGDDDEWDKGIFGLKCGCVGLEALFLILLVGLLRRRFLRSSA